MRTPLKPPMSVGFTSRLALIGEYERTATTALNAYIAPRVVSILRRRYAFARVGLTQPMLLIQTNGGAFLAKKWSPPATLLLSGSATASVR